MCGEEVWAGGGQAASWPRVLPQSQTKGTDGIMYHNTFLEISKFMFTMLDSFHLSHPTAKQRLSPQSLGLVHWEGFVGLHWTLAWHFGSWKTMELVIW